MRSIFRNPSWKRIRGDGEAKRPRADGIARLTAKAYPAAETPGLKPESTRVLRDERQRRRSRLPRKSAGFV